MATKPNEKSKWQNEKKVKQQRTKKKQKQWLKNTAQRYSTKSCGVLYLFLKKEKVGISYTETSATSTWSWWQIVLIP